MKGEKHWHPSVQRLTKIYSAQQFDRQQKNNAYLVVVVAGDDVPRHTGERVGRVNGVPGVRKPVAVVVALDACGDLNSE